MVWTDTPENRQAFTAEVARMIADAGGNDALAERALHAWEYVNEHMHVDPAKLSRADLEQAYTDAMSAGWHLARISWAVTGSLLDGGDARSYNAAKGGSGKIAKNPEAAAKAAAKAAALELWKERHAGKHPKLGTVEQYATEVMRRWPLLTSAKVICGWSAKWTKQVRAGQNPAC